MRIRSCPMTSLSICCAAKALTSHGAPSPNIARRLASDHRCNAAVRSCCHQPRRPERACLQKHYRDYAPRSEEHTSEHQSLMRISYAVFCLKKKTTYIEIENESIIK